ncbi:ATP-dependent DNA helicase sgs1, partial [Cryomyces antarcticus]
MNKAGFATQYIRLGKNCNDFKHGRRRLKIQVRISPNGKVKKPPKPVTKKDGKKRAAGAARQDYPLSTNVSSPIQAASKRRLARYEHHEELHPNGYYRDSFVVSDPADDDFVDNDEQSDDAFEPIREAGRPRKETRKELGPPITIDEKMERLNATHRMVVDDFVNHAKRECNEILISKSLRAAPFTDTVLREMAINFPKTEPELCAIAGIDPDKVQLYGKRFLKLIRNAEDFYENVMR